MGVRFWLKRISGFAGVLTLFKFRFKNDLFKEKIILQQRNIILGRGEPPSNWSNNNN